ncbi:UTRA domain-containing protein [Lipingzhangella sp. LS1_29]|uniref:UTRA domain-containing protein n=1 Tax=Lipingzhangella rawalii TaxID=2055835 RepID=A0ABU2HAT0_9ACTN|nr:UTRA domain-containing protein [Lipingzhangella rawalii]MDS1272426.1 UTRA domain-containing protein [Lipingzhangella rawalii]
MASGSWVSSSAAYVRPPEVGAPDAWTTEAAQRGGRGTQRIVHAGEVRAGPQVAPLLHMEEDQTVVVRRRIIYLDDVPTELTDTYYPASIAANTALAESAKIRGGAIALLHELGYVGSHVREEVSARLPDTGERDVLDLEETQPVLTLVRVTLDVTGTPIQADLMTMPAHRQRLRYEMPLP